MAKTVRNVVIFVLIAAIVAIVLSFGIFSTNYKGDSKQVMDHLGITATVQEDGTLTMDIVAEGNKLVYVYTYQTDLDIEATKEALATAIEQQASVFENVAKEIKNAVNVENPIVEVRYLAKDGTEIYSQEFTAAE